MAVAAAGLVSLPLNYLRLTVAGSAAFQTWVGAINAAAALPRVYPVSTTTFTMPFAVVDWDKNFRRTKIAGGLRNHFEQSGDLMLIFRAAVNAAHDDPDAAYTFLNLVGSIIGQMELLAGTAGYLNITAITLEQGPLRPGDDEKETAGDYYEVVYRIEFEGL